MWKVIRFEEAFLFCLYDAEKLGWGCVKSSGCAADEQDWMSQVCLWMGLGLCWGWKLSCKKRGEFKNIVGMAKHPDTRAHMVLPSL